MRQKQAKTGFILLAAVVAIALLVFAAIRSANQAGSDKHSESHTEAQGSITTSAVPTHRMPTEGLDLV